MTIAIVDARPSKYIVIAAGAEVASAAAAQAAAQVVNAEAQVALAATEADRAEAAVASIDDVRRAAMLKTNLPVGSWIEPTEYTGVTWPNKFGVKLYSDGLNVWPMYLEATALPGWRIPFGPRVRFPDTNAFYVAVDPAYMIDGTRQGLAVTQLHFAPLAGNDTTGTGSSLLPYKTFERCMTAVNAGAVGVYEIIAHIDVWCPGNFEGLNPTAIIIEADRWVTLTFLPRADGTKPWILPGMRYLTYLQADWNFVDVGDGWWQATGSGISTGAKNTPIGFDLETLDEYGRPIPILMLSGTAATVADVKTAAGGAKRASYYRTSDNAYFLRITSGAKPNPGVNWSYVETITAFSVLPKTNARFVVRGGRFIHNTQAGAQSMFQCRPYNIVVGPTAPAVNHGGQIAWIDCEFYGSSLNAISHIDITRSAMSGCTDGYNGADGVGISTLYEPGNSNDPVMGSYTETFVMNHISADHGPCGFRLQPAENTSAQSYTSHGRCPVTVINSVGLRSNGSNVAAIGGAKMLLVNSAICDPEPVTTSPDIHPVPFLASGNSPYDVNIKTEVNVLFCSSYVRPSLGKTFYASGNGRIVAVGHVGRTDKLLFGNGAVEDGYGAAL